MMQELGWKISAATSQPVDWREIDLVAERIGALPDAPLPMPVQAFDAGRAAARQAFWLRLLSALTARAGH